MKISKAVFAAAVASMTLTTTAEANSWKMEPLSQQTTIIPQAQELQDNESRQFLCMALTIYHEARGTSQTGQRAVAHVVLNRTQSKQFPGSVCDVVWQHYRNRPQFSWTTRPVGGILPRERAAWAEAQNIAYEMLHGGEVQSDPTGGATHFYNVRLVRPEWANRAVHSWRSGAHMFVRLRGL